MLRAVIILLCSIAGKVCGRKGKECFVMILCFRPLNFLLETNRGAVQQQNRKQNVKYPFGRFHGGKIRKCRMIGKLEDWAIYDLRKMKVSMRIIPFGNHIKGLFLSRVKREFGSMNFDLVLGMVKVGMVSCRPFMFLNR